MEKVTKIEQLKSGDKIVRIDRMNGKPEFMEFVCIHPHHSGYSIFLDMYENPMKKYYNRYLKECDWYRYVDPDSWLEIYQLEINYHLEQIEYLKKQIGAFEEQHKKEHGE